MAQIGVSPLVLKDVVLEIGTDTYEKHVSTVRFVPESETIRWQGLHPDAKYTDQSAADWSCEMTYVQDWETASSLSLFLFENEGETVAVEFKPRSGSGPSFTANLTITPGAIGGNVNTFTETTVTLGSDKPVLVPAV